MVNPFSRFLVLVCFASASCADPVIGEESATLDSCRNGFDDDLDGATDCQDQRCRDAGFCTTFDTTCTIFPQSGCPIGMGCFARYNESSGVTSYRCQTEGVGTSFVGCDLTKVYEPSEPHQCRGGSACTGDPEPALCTLYCTDDQDCEPGGTCTENGSCTTPCDPSRMFDTCGAGTVCTSYHRFGYAFDFGGARFACYVPARTRGTADVGDVCVDPPSATTADEEICLNRLACVPDAVGVARCATVCVVGSSTCAAFSKSCVPFYPGEWPSAFGTNVLGYCL